MCSCCEDEYYEVSCSVEERIDRELWESNEKERRDRDILNDLRQRNYQQVYSSKTSKVFGLPGLQFVRFTHLSVKFSFVPSLLFEMISKRIVLYISLRYLPRYNKWILRREPLPADRRFHFNKFFCNTRIDDMKLNTVIFVIYLRLKKWSIELADFNKKKKKEFEEGRIEPLDLLSEDEELLLTEEQRQLLHERRLKILRRMIPPRSPRTNRKRKGEKRMILSSSSDD